MPTRRPQGPQSWAARWSPLAADIPYGEGGRGRSQVEACCASRVPEGLEDQIGIECSVRGRTITIAVRRSPWKPECGPDWSERKIAQLRCDGKRGAWSLYAADRNSRWFAYDNIGATKDVGPLLKEIEADPIGIFWG